MTGAPVRAPEIDRPGTTWLNVTAPLRLDDLRGRFVLLDFWTFCCINCLQVLPALRRIEESFPDDVVVIGVHTPKFFAEREAENVSAALGRYDIRHPVIHDPNMTLWREYAVRAWPTLVFIDPSGYVLGQFAGEPDPDKLHASIEGLIRQGRDEGVMQPRSLALVAPDQSDGALSYPGKIKALPGAGWVIADSGHHQVAVFDEEGRETVRYGSGEAGFADGPAAMARFNAPQGLVADDARVYVADTGNHAIRAIDRTTGMVSTIAGTGRRGRPLADAAPAHETALASPWDLEIEGGRLYVANAGTHQLGVLDLAAGTLARLAGTGAEALVDGEARDEAVLAQPSGLALDPVGRRLAFADSETSSIRLLDLEEGMVSTLVGTGLFDFGHREGPFDGAQFQHPLGVAWASDGLVVADSYNRAVRLLDLEARESRSLEPGMTCLDPLCLRLGEPAGVAVMGDGRILLSDTNNHRILVMDPTERSYATWLS